VLSVISLQVATLGSAGFAWMYVSLILHEAAHAGLARAAGFEPPEIVVGQGPVLFTIEVDGVPMGFRLLPVGGLTVTRPRAGSTLRRRRALFPAAGIGTDLILALVLLGLAVPYYRGAPLGPAFLAAGKAGCPWQGALGWLLVLQTLRLLGNVIPRNIRGAHGLRIPSDGRQVLLYLSGREVAYRFEHGAASMGRLSRP
jgi:hypothetical protein